MASEPSSIRQVRGILTKLQENFQCVICLDLLSEPVSTGCNHQFCRGCITRIAAKRNAMCPLCKQPLSKRGLNANEHLSEIVEGVRLLVDAATIDTSSLCTPPLRISSQRISNTPAIEQFRRMFPTPVKRKQSDVATSGESTAESDSEETVETNVVGAGSRSLAKGRQPIAQQRASSASGAASASRARARTQSGPLPLARAGRLTFNKSAGRKAAKQRSSNTSSPTDVHLLQDENCDPLDFPSEVPSEMQARGSKRGGRRVRSLSRQGATAAAAGTVGEPSAASSPVLQPVALNSNSTTRLTQSAGKPKRGQIPSACEYCGKAVGIRSWTRHLTSCPVLLAMQASSLASDDMPSSNTRRSRLSTQECVGEVSVSAPATANKPATTSSTKLCRRVTRASSVSLSPASPILPRVDGTAAATPPTDQHLDDPSLSVPSAEQVNGVASASLHDSATPAANPESCSPPGTLPFECSDVDEPHPSPGGLPASFSIRSAVSSSASPAHTAPGDCGQQVAVQSLSSPPRVAAAASAIEDTGDEPQTYEFSPPRFCPSGGAAPLTPSLNNSGMQRALRRVLVSSDSDRSASPGSGGGGGDDPPSHHPSLPPVPEVAAMEVIGEDSQRSSSGTPRRRTTSSQCSSQSRLSQVAASTEGSRSQAGSQKAVSSRSVSPFNLCSLCGLPPEQCGECFQCTQGTSTAAMVSTVSRGIFDDEDESPTGRLLRRASSRASAAAAAASAGELASEATTAEETGNQALGANVSEPAEVDSVECATVGGPAERESSSDADCPENAVVDAGGGDKAEGDAGDGGDVNPADLTSSFLELACMNMSGDDGARHQVHESLVGHETPRLGVSPVADSTEAGVDTGKTATSVVPEDHACAAEESRHSQPSATTATVSGVTGSQPRGSSQRSSGTRLAEEVQTLHEMFMLDGSARQVGATLPQRTVPAERPPAEPLAADTCALPDAQHLSASRESTCRDETLDSKPLSESSGLSGGQLQSNEQRNASDMPALSPSSQLTASDCLAAVASASSDIDACDSSDRAEVTGNGSASLMEDNGQQQLPNSFPADGGASAGIGTYDDIIVECTELDDNFVGGLCHTESMGAAAAVAVATADSELERLDAAAGDGEESVKRVTSPPVSVPAPLPMDPAVTDAGAEVSSEGEDGAATAAGPLPFAGALPTATAVAVAAESEQLNGDVHGEPSVEAVASPRGEVDAGDDDDDDDDADDDVIPPTPPAGDVEEEETQADATVHLPPPPPLGSDGVLKRKRDVSAKSRHSSPPSLKALASSESYSTQDVSRMQCELDNMKGELDFLNAFLGSETSTDNTLQTTESSPSLNAESPVQPRRSVRSRKTSILSCSLAQQPTLEASAPRPPSKAAIAALQEERPGDISSSCLQQAVDPTPPDAAASGRARRKSSSSQRARGASQGQPAPRHGLSASCQEQGVISGTAEAALQVQHDDFSASCLEQAAAATPRVTVAPPLEHDLSASCLEYAAGVSLPAPTRQRDPSASCLAQAAPSLPNSQKDDQAAVDDEDDNDQFTASCLEQCFNSGGSATSRRRRPSSGRRLSSSGRAAMSTPVNELLAAPDSEEVLAADSQPADSQPALRLSAASAKRRSPPESDGSDEEVIGLRKKRCSSTRAAVIADDDDEDDDRADDMPLSAMLNDTPPDDSDDDDLSSLPSVLGKPTPCKSQVLGAGLESSTRSSRASPAPSASVGGMVSGSPACRVAGAELRASLPAEASQPSLPASSSSCLQRSLTPSCPGTKQSIPPSLDRLSAFEPTPPPAELGEFPSHLLRSSPAVVAENKPQSAHCHGVLAVPEAPVDDARDSPSLESFDGSLPSVLPAIGRQKTRRSAVEHRRQAGSPSRAASSARRSMPARLPAASGSPSRGQQSSQALYQMLNVKRRSRSGAAHQERHTAAVVDSNVASPAVVPVSASLRRPVSSSAGPALPSRSADTPDDGSETQDTSCHPARASTVRIAATPPHPVAAPVSSSNRAQTSTRPLAKPRVTSPPSGALVKPHAAMSPPSAIISATAVSTLVSPPNRSSTSTAGASVVSPPAELTSPPVPTSTSSASERTGDYDLGFTSSGRVAESAYAGSNMSIVLSTPPAALVSRIHVLKQRHGIRLAHTLSRASTHVVFNSDHTRVVQQSVKYFQALAARTWMVTVSWLEECYNTGKLVNEELHEVIGDRQGFMGAPRKARFARRFDEPPLFHEFAVYLSGQFYVIGKDILAQILQIGGALILDSARSSCPKEKTLIVLFDPDAGDPDVPSDFGYVTILSAQWALDSLASYRLLPMADFAPCINADIGETDIMADIYDS